MNDTNGDGINEIVSDRISGYFYVGQQVMCKININGTEDYMYYNYTSGLWEVNSQHREHKKSSVREDENYYYVPVTSINVNKYRGVVINFTVIGEGKNNHTYLANNIVNKKESVGKRLIEGAHF